MKDMSMHNSLLLGKKELTLKSRIKLILSCFAYPLAYEAEWE